MTPLGQKGFVNETVLSNSHTWPGGGGGIPQLKLTKGADSFKIFWVEQGGFKFFSRI